jgi:hypothetical protein
MKRRAWTTKDVRTLKKLAGKRTRATKIARTLRRTEGATRQKAFSLGLSLETQSSDKRTVRTRKKALLKIVLKDLNNRAESTG